MEKNYRMVLQYDGTGYDGWQKQKFTENTIQGILETALGKLLEPGIRVHGSGRTDAGVHAAGQVANFKSLCELKGSEILSGLRPMLPADISVIHLEETASSFHSRYSAQAKTYEYRILAGPRRVFTRRYEHLVEAGLNLDDMRQAASYLIGAHDFKAFSTKRKGVTVSRRRIDQITISEQQGRICLRYHGSGFLYHMVRIISGTLIGVGQGARKPEDILDILIKKDRSLAGPLAPAGGLFLMGVEYDGFSSEDFYKGLGKHFR